jgi:hypothetical protein
MGKGLSRCNIEWIELVLLVKSHHLTERVQGLKTLGKDSLDLELKLVDHREEVLGNWSVLKSSLNGSAGSK